MKKLFLMLAAAAAVVSCSKDYTIVADQGEAIEFGNAFVDNSTRAADLTYGAVTLDHFNLYGTVTGTAGTINIYDGCTVTGTAGTAGVWTCPVNQYWIAGASYKFAAVVDADDVAKDAYNMPTALTYNTSGQKDLLYDEATATGLATGNEKVNFTFSHLLAKTQFTVKSNTQNGYYYSVKNIKVNNFETGTYTIANSSWAGTTAKDVEFGNIENVTVENNNITNETQMLLIPTTSDFTVSFTVELWNANGDAEDVKLSTQDYTKTVSQDLVAGHAYDFNINLSVGELIQFTVTSNPTWADETDVDVTL